MNFIRFKGDISAWREVIDISVVSTSDAEPDLQSTQNFSLDPPRDTKFLLRGTLSSSQAWPRATMAHNSHFSIK